MDILDGILDRIETGMTTMGDAVALRIIVDEMRQDIATLTTIIEREMDHEQQSLDLGQPVSSGTA